MKCPSCNAEASGNFCSSCGHPLRVEKCSSCGASVFPGSKFCTNCGEPFGTKRSGRKGARNAQGPAAPSGTSMERPVGKPAPVPTGNATMAWWVAGGLLVVTLVALGYPVLTRDSAPDGGMGGAGAPPGSGGMEGGPGAVDLTTMTLEEQGTILFNRVMSSSSNGDQADVDFFLPKALVIYEQMDPKDPDGLYHYALLHMAGESYQPAIEKVQEGLAQVPTHVLLLGVGAEAAVGLGDSATARTFYTQLLEAYDSELALSRAGYDHHQPMFPAYRAAAESFLNR